MYTTQSSQQRNSTIQPTCTVNMTEDYVLQKYLPCIPQGDTSQIYEVMKKSQQQYLHQYQQQSHQQQTQQQLKKSSEKLDEEKEQNGLQQVSQAPFTYNTPQYTKVVIDKIVASLTGPSDNHEIELHVLHMRQLAQEQEKNIQRAMIEGEKSKFNRKACEFSNVAREEPQKYCAEYYEQQLQLHQQYMNQTSAFFQQSRYNQQQQQATCTLTYGRPNSDTTTTNTTTASHLNTSYHSSTQNQQRFESEPSNILQSRCSNTFYSTANTTSSSYPSKLLQNNTINNGQVNNPSSECPKQNSYSQNQQLSTPSQQSLILQQQQQTNQNSNGTTTLQLSSQKHKKQSKTVSSSLAGKENAGTSMGIISSKINKENKNKKRTHSHLRQISSQNPTNNNNNNQSSVTASSSTPATPLLVHQQQSPPIQTHGSTAPIVQQNQTYHNYQVQPQHPIYNNQFGYRTMYPAPQIYYNQQTYNNQNQINMPAIQNAPNYVNQQACSGYYYPQQSAPRNVIYPAQQNNSNNSCISNNQAFFPKQENFIEENTEIASQIENPMIEMNNNINNNNNNNNNGNNNSNNNNSNTNLNNHMLHQQNYEDFFRSQDQDQQLTHQPHLSQQNPLQPSNLDNQEDLENDQVDDMINDYLS